MRFRAGKPARCFRLSPVLENYVKSRNTRQSYLENQVISRKLRHIEKLLRFRENAYNTLGENCATLRTIENGHNEFRRSQKCAKEN